MGRNGRSPFKVLWLKNYSVMIEEENGLRPTRAMVRYPRSVHGRHSVARIHGRLAASLGRLPERSHTRPGNGDVQTARVELDTCYLLGRVPDDTHVTLLCPTTDLDGGTIKTSASTSTFSTASTSGLVSDAVALGLLPSIKSRWRILHTKMPPLSTNLGECRNAKYRYKCFTCPSRPGQYPSSWHSFSGSPGRGSWDSRGTSWGFAVAPSRFFLLRSL